MSSQTGNDEPRQGQWRGDFTRDTCSRAKVVWQVKAILWSNLVKVSENSSSALRELAKMLDPPNERVFLRICQLIKQVWPECVSLLQPPNHGLLKARADAKDKTNDPCCLSPESRYRGVENQLYRVEIHDGGTKKEATFKWSRDNGSVVFPLRASIEKSEANEPVLVQLVHLGRDSRTGLEEGDWVEVVDDDYVHRNRPEPLLRVAKIDRDTMTVTLEGEREPDSSTGKDLAKHPHLRRWDQKLNVNKYGTARFAEIPLGREGRWIDLEDGIQVSFWAPKEKGQEHVYRTCDYWLIPARVATGDMEWPQEKDAAGGLTPKALPPHGVQHHYAPLGIVYGVDRRWIVIPCECVFKPLASCSEE